MLFISYFEIGEEGAAEARLQAAQNIMAKGLFPVEGVNIIRWDTSPDNWGVLISEAANIEALTRAINVWRLACPGFFKMTKTSPAMPVQEQLPMLAGVMQALKG